MHLTNTVFKRVFFIETDYAHKFGVSIFFNMSSIVIATYRLFTKRKRKKFSNDDTYLLAGGSFPRRKNRFLVDPNGRCLIL